MPPVGGFPSFTLLACPPAGASQAHTFHTRSLTHTAGHETARKISTHKRRRVCCVISSSAVWVRTSLLRPQCTQMDRPKPIGKNLLTIQLPLRTPLPPSLTCCTLFVSVFGFVLHPPLPVVGFLCYRAKCDTHHTLYPPGTNDGRRESTCFDASKSWRNPFPLSDAKIVVTFFWRHRRFAKVLSYL